MSSKPPEKTERNILYHILMGLGFLALIGWFWLMREIEFMSWLSAMGPASHTGAMNLLAIMVWMLPGLLCWKYYVRYINRKLKITGIFYEDHFYRSDATSDDSTSSGTEKKQRDN